MGPRGCHTGGDRRTAQEQGSTEGSLLGEWPVTLGAKQRGDWVREGSTRGCTEMVNKAGSVVQMAQLHPVDNGELLRPFREDKM